MIKIWTIHFEMHKGYIPKLKIFRAPRHGDRVVDGGIPGVLVACKECSGVGLLHVPDYWPDSGVAPAQPMSDHASPPAMDFNASLGNDRGSPEVLTLDYTLGTGTYRVGETVWTHNAEYVVAVFEPAKVLVLHRKGAMPHILSATSPEPSGSTAPDTAVLDLTEADHKPQIGEVVQYKGADYRVEQVSYHGGGRGSLFLLRLDLTQPPIIKIE